MPTSTYSHIPSAFEKNIEALRDKNFELTAEILSAQKGAKKSDNLQILTSKTGLPSLKAGGIAIHSLYDPVKEAQEWIKYYREKLSKTFTIVVFGFGLGYHVTELLRYLKAEGLSGDVFVFEPRHDILRTAFEITDLSHILHRIRFITDDEVLNLSSKFLVGEIKKDFLVLKHEPSVNLSPTYFGHIQSRLKVMQKINKGLKIMVVGPIYGGSLPIAEYCASALKKLGHEVDFVDNSVYKDAYFSVNKITSDKSHQTQLREMLVSFISEAVIARCAEFMPDLVFALAQAPLGSNSLAKLRQSKIPTAFWFVEDFRLMDYWQGIAPLYDYFFVIQRGDFFDALKKSGITNFKYLPMAASMDEHKRLNLTEEELKIYGSDVSFVGAGYYNRRKFFTGLIDFDFKIWGSEWDVGYPLSKHVQKGGERIETDNIAKIFNASKININLHSSTRHEGINPDGDFVNPRTFEIASCEGFQLVDYRSELPELFSIGKEIVCFEGISDLRDKINYYLNNQDRRQEIALKGRERVEKEHTYELRMEEMLNFILNKGYEPPLWPNQEMDNVADIIKEAGENTELGKYLSRFSDKENISLSDVIEEIKNGDGRLSEVEKVFMLAKEFEKQFCRKKKRQ
jgi:spore maturation protein CgeB